MWTLNLNPETTISNQEVPTAPPKTLNVIFDLPSSRKTFLWYHASAGFPPKVTFVDAVRKGNYATWPKLTVTLIMVDDLSPSWESFCCLFIIPSPSCFLLLVSY
jgi:hypothetical protein